MTAAAALPPSEPEAFAPGDVVIWRRDVGTHDVITQGTIVSVIPPGVHPSERRHWPHLDLPLFAREHESYVVLATTGSYYWPRVDLLARVAKRPRGRAVSQ